MILVDTLKFLKTAAVKTAEIGWILEVRYDKDTTRYYSRHVHEIGILAHLLGNLISTLTAHAICRITAKSGEYDYIQAEFENAISYTEAVTEIVRQWHNYTLELLQCAEPERLIETWRVNGYEPPHIVDYREACDMLKLAIDLDKTIDTEMTMYAEKVEQLARLAAAHEAQKKETQNNEP